MRGALSGVLVRPVVALRDAVAAVVDGHAVARAAPELEGRARCNQIGRVRSSNPFDFEECKMGAFIQQLPGRNKFGNRLR